MSFLTAVIAASGPFMFGQSPQIDDDVAQRRVAPRSITGSSNPMSAGKSPRIVILSAGSRGRVTWAVIKRCISCNDLSRKYLTTALMWFLLSYRPCFYTRLLFSIFTRAMGLCESNVSVRLSVRPSVTRRYCIKRRKLSTLFLHHLVAPRF